MPEDTLEELIFRSAISQEGSALWGEPWTDTDHTLEWTSPTQHARTALLELERLFDTAETQPAAEARHHLDELARIIELSWRPGQ